MYREDRGKGCKYLLSKSGKKVDYDKLMNLRLTEDHVSLRDALSEKGSVIGRIFGLWNPLEACA